MTGRWRSGVRKTWSTTHDDQSDARHRDRELSGSRTDPLSQWQSWSGRRAAPGHDDARRERLPRRRNKTPGGGQAQHV